MLDTETQDFSGLSTREAQSRLQQYGKNVVEEKPPHRLITFAKKFWAPIPWMLEITILLQLALHKYEEAVIIFVLLVFNSMLSFFQEGHANKALALLRHHLAVKARVLRDAKWHVIPAEEIVPGDIVHLRMGDISPADIKLMKGNILIDQSVLTGEAMPVEGEAGKIAYSGARIRRGEATGEVIATGQKTYFGKSVELIQTAKAQSHVKKIIYTIIKYLITIDCFLAFGVFIFAVITNLPLTDIIPFVLILIVASIPVALPTTFTLATALAAIELAKKGVLVTHLTAIEEAATMDVVCVDKTGTITQNQLKIATLKPFAPYTETDLLYFAVLASDESSQDPIDQAILSKAKLVKGPILLPERFRFIPFDPAIKHTEAIFNVEDGQLRVVKGTPDIIALMAKKSENIAEDVMQLAESGYRILAVGVDKHYDGKAEKNIDLIGLIALNDPVRGDSKPLLQQLKQYGLHILMVTGDNVATAKAVAANLNMRTSVASPHILQSDHPDNILDYDVFAGMFPENKFHLIKALQASNHIVGMTGDGINDAPALKQAEVGIAVSNAMDVPKAAASIILMKAGLSGILSAIEVSRRVYQRMLTYILNKIIKSFEIAIFLSVGVILTGKMIITPFLIVLLLFTNDFMTMSIATDRVSYSYKPERWQIANLMIVGAIFSGLILSLSFPVFFYALHVLKLTLPQLQTLIFVMLVFTSQGIIYLIRERKHFWNSLPSQWLILSSIGDIVIVTLLATQGILMEPIHFSLIIKLLTVIIIYLFFIDFIKVRVFFFFNIH